MNIAQAASMVSAYPIIGVDLIDSKLEMGKNFGLSHTINSAKENLHEALKNILDKGFVDISIETGNTKVIEDAFSITKDNGKTILVGVPKKGENINIYSLPLHFNKILKGSHGGDSKPDDEIPRFINLIKEKKMTLSGIITHEFSLDQINEAIKLFERARQEE